MRTRARAGSPEGREASLPPSPGKQAFLAGLLSAALVLALAFPLRAGEGPSASAARFGPVDLSADRVAASRRGEGVVLAAWGATIRWEGAVLTAERAVLWVNPAKETPRAVAEELRKAAERRDFSAMAEATGSLDVAVYAEGAVRVEWAGGDVVTCELFLFDFAARRGRMTRARADLATAFGKTAVPPGSRLVARAEEIRVALGASGETVLTLKDAGITDCEFIDPHYEFTATEVRIEIGKGADPSVWVTLRDLVPRAFGIPLFYLPYLVWNADWRPMIRLKPGHSDRLGWFVRAGVGMEIKAPKPGDPTKERRLATLWALGDEFGGRGPGAGFEGRWRWPGEAPFRGDALLYYVHDRGDHRPIAESLGWYPPPREDRWRAYLYHRQSVPSVGARADLEVNALGDENFLTEFFERELRTEKPPETYLQLLEAWENHGGTLLVRPRVNDFQTEVEELPRLLYRGVSQPLPYGVGVLDLGLMADHARLRPDDRDPTRRSERLWRFDGWGEWALPLPIREVALEPFLRARYSAFERSAAGEGAIDRVALEGGIRTGIQAWRDFDVEAGALGIHGLRHTVSIHADYVDRFVVTTPPADLVPVDDLERVDLVRRIDLRFTNRFYTWNGAGAFARDVLFLEAEASWFADPDRDNAGETWGPAIFDVRLAPVPWGGLRGFASFDLDAGAFVRWDAEAWMEPATGVRFSLGTHNVSGTVHTTAARAAVRFDERWAAEFEEMYDFERGRQVSAALRVRRTLHRWVLEVGIQADRTRKDVGVSVTFMPLLTAPKEWW